MSAAVSMVAPEPTDAEERDVESTALVGSKADEELPDKTADDNAATTAALNYQKRKSARRVRARCHQFKQGGSCSKGDLCEFAHSA